MERGLEQRVRALGLFLDDVYGEQRILAEQPELREFVLGTKLYLPQLRHVRPPGGVRIHVSGIDLIRDQQGVFRVLEDNLRTPSGVSYVLESRIVSKRVMPEVFEQARVRQVDHYPARLAETLRAVSPEAPERSTVVVLTPGPYNSAYFEHTFLARTMGVELVHPADLFVDDDKVFVRTTRGPRRVHVIYRRIDDAFLDPEVFRPDSMLGRARADARLRRRQRDAGQRPGQRRGGRQGRLRLRAGHDPLLPLRGAASWSRCRPTCARARTDRAYVLDNLEELVVKTVDEAGGYGMLMGPQSTARGPRGVPPAHPRRAPPVRGAAPAWSCPPAPRGSPTRGWWRPGGWTCGPTSSPVPRGPGCCPAA